MKSSGLKGRLLKTEFKDRTWTLLVEGLPKTVYPVKFRTRSKPNHIIGGKLLDSAAGGIRVGLVSPANATKSHVDFVRWQAKITWR